MNIIYQREVIGVIVGLISPVSVSLCFCNCLKIPRVFLITLLVYFILSVAPSLWWFVAVLSLWS